MHQQSRPSVCLQPQIQINSEHKTTFYLRRKNTHNLKTNAAKSSNLGNSSLCMATQLCNRSNGSTPAGCQGKQRLALFHTLPATLLHCQLHCSTASNTATLSHSSLHWHVLASIFGQPSTLKHIDFGNKL